MNKDLVIYLVIYLIPMAALMAASAPELEVWPRLKFAGYRLGGRALAIFGVLTLVNLCIRTFLELAIGPHPWLASLAWELVYIWFAMQVGPWLHD